MIVNELQPLVDVPLGETKAPETWRDHLRQLGVLLVKCSDGGVMTESQALGEDWLYDLITGSPIFHSAMRTAARAWAKETSPTHVQPFPGLWLVPHPILLRRRRVGYHVAIILTEPLLSAEQLAAMCQRARMDFDLCKRMLAKLPLASPVDVDRLASLLRIAHDQQARAESDQRAIDSVGKQLAESYEEISLLYTISQNMTVRQRPERFVFMACQELLNTMAFAWIGAQIVEDHNRFKDLAGRLIVAGTPPRPLSELEPATKAVLGRLDATSCLVLDTTSNPEHSAFDVLGRTAVVQPVLGESEIIGVLIAGEKHGPDPAISSADIKLLGATASHLSIFLENAELYDNINTMFLGTLEALTASIDAKDRYTCGHSRRVASLTQQLAQAIGMDEHTVNRMHIAGLVHDVGKIGVPEAVLSKPGKLTDEEFAWIRQHPEIGYRILKDIPQLHDILPGVLYHHERWDGRGYPERLGGEEIPLVARLIGLADAFDAMSSTRTYRPAMSRTQTLDEIINCAGTQFDPELAMVFIKLDFGNYDRQIRQHQAWDVLSLATRHKAA